MIRFLLMSLLVAGALAVAVVPLPPTLAAKAEAWSEAIGEVMRSRPPTPTFRTAAVERHDVVATVQAAGTLSALQLVEVSTPVSGQIKALYADFNGQVSAGQMIARIDPETHEARVAQAEAELEIAHTQVALQRAHLDRAAADLESAQAGQATVTAQTLQAELALEDAARDQERKRALVRGAIVAAGEWEKVQSARKTAQAQVTAAQAQEIAQAAERRAADAALRMAEAQLANTLAQVKQKEALLNQARIDLERTIIRAPVTGVVIDRAVSVGQTVAASLQAPTLFTIAEDLTRMQVEASVVEADISSFRAGQPVRFTVDAYPQRSFDGTVSQVRKAPQITQNVVTYTVIIATRNPQQLLFPGMTATLEVEVARRPSVLAVPNAALRYRPAQTVEQPGDMLPDTGTGTTGLVFLADDSGLPRRARVRLGITDGAITEILAGPVAEGDRVLIGEAAAPRTGEPVGGRPALVSFRWR